MKKVILIVIMVIASSFTFSNNILGVHLGGFVNGSIEPTMVLSNTNWSVKTHQNSVSQFTTNITITDPDSSNSMPIKFAIGIYGNIGEYQMEIDGNGRKEILNDMYGEMSLDELGVFYGNASGVSYPLSFSYKNIGSDSVDIEGRMVLTAYYES